MARSLRITSLLFIFATLVALNVQRASAQLIVAVDEDEEFVKHIDLTTEVATDLFKPLDSVVGGAAGDGPEGIAADEANRIFYWQDGNNLYSTAYDEVDGNGFMVSHKIADIRCSTCTADTNVDGLTFANGILYAVRNEAAATTGPEGLYSINVTNGVATLLRNWDDDPGVPAAADVDIRDIAYNPTDGLFYIYNNDTGTGINNNGAGIYSVDVNNVLGGGAYAIALVEATPTIVSLCPTGCGTNAIPDVDGMALGNGKIYLTIDQPGPTLVYDIATDVFETSITNPWTTTESGAGGTWAPTVLDGPAGADLANTLSATYNALDLPEDGTVGVGDEIIYTVTNVNFGSEDAGAMEYEIVFSGSAGFNVVSATGNASTPDTSVPGTVTGTLSPFIVDAQEVITITVAVTSPGIINATATISAVGNPPDNLPNNNTSTHFAEVRAFPANSAALFTELVNAPGSGTSSFLPDAGVNVDPMDSGTSTNIYPPYRSPDGRYVGLVVRTTAPANQDNAIVLIDNGVISTPVQRGITAIDGFPTETPGEFILRPRVAINNSGSFAFNSGLGTGDFDRSVLRFDGSPALTVLARDGDLIPAFAAQNFRYPGSSVSWDSVGFNGNGEFTSRLDFVVNAPTGQATMLLSESGATSLLQSGVDVPAGTSETFREFIDERFWIDGAGISWAAEGLLNGDTNTDGALVVNGEVVIQEDDVLTGLTSPVRQIATASPAQVFTSTTMNSNGDWYVLGQNDNIDEDWVVKGHGSTFSVIAKGGAPIHTGATDLWDDATGQSGDGFGPGFHFVAGNNQGDYVIGGRTNRANRRKNTVAVLNGTTIVLREGDPVDIDGNGLFDDNRFVRTFDSDSATLTDDGEFLVVVQTTDNSGTADSGALTGRALVRLQVTASSIPVGADVVVLQTVSEAFLPTVGAETVYTVKICNLGQEEATNVVLTDTLPAQFDFVSATNGGTETSPGSGIITATIPSIPAYSCVEVDITAVAVAEGVDTVNSATAAANETDPNNVNNTATALVTVENQSDLAVVKVDDGGGAVGQNFTYTITITNNGPAVATNVAMTDTLDPTTNFVSATNGATETAPGSGTVTANFASIAVGNSEVVQITVVGTVEAIVTNNVSVDGTETDIVPENSSTFVDTLVGEFADISVAILSDDAYHAGGLVTYAVVVANGGPKDATNVPLTITLDPSLTFVAATGGGTETAPGSDIVTATIPFIPVLGSTTIQVYATAGGAGVITTTALVDENATQQADPDGLNNSATSLALVGVFRTTEVIHTEISGHPTAVVPGAMDPGGTPVFAEFESMLGITMSPDRTRWLMRGDTSQATADDNYLMQGAGKVGTVIAQASQAVPGGGAGEFWDFFDTEFLGGFNTAGDFAFSARTKGGTTGTLERGFRSIGGVISEILRENSPVFGLDDPNGGGGNETVGNGVNSVHLMDNGDVRMLMDNLGGLTAPESEFDEATVRWDSGSQSLNRLLQENRDLLFPGSVDTWDDFIAASYYTTPDGLHYFIQGDDLQATANDAVLVVDDAVVLREGSATDGVIVSSPQFSNMLANGTWFSRVDKLPTANGDVAYRNGIAIAQTGGSVSGGAELWGASLTAVTGNQLGDYVVAGPTNNANTLVDSVMVLNGTTELIREGDPIDLNQNGKFDDDVFFAGFKVDAVGVTDSQIVYFLATLRNAEGNALGDAFLRLNFGCPTIHGDTNANVVLNGDDIQELSDCILTPGAPVGQCKCADLDMDGDVDFVDISAAITLYLNQ